MSFHGPGRHVALLFGASLIALAGATPALAQTADQTTAPDQTTPAPSPSQSTNTSLPSNGSGNGTAVTPAQANGGGDIIVTGLRRSVETAQAIKFNSAEFVDSVTATDIGKLPDRNVAEALQRISGVQIDRNYGEGSGLAIRGLTQVKTELNGRDVFGGSGGRELGFEDVPSELLAGVDVYKDPSAEEIEGGIGGLVNLRTRMPFDQKGFLLAANMGANYFDLAKDARFNGSVLASKTWEDTPIGKIGILADLSYYGGRFRRDQITIEPYVPTTNVPGHVGETLYMPDGAGIQVTDGNRKRRGYYAALQWEPAHNLQLYGTYFRSQYDIYTPNYSSFVTRGTSTEFLQYLTPGAASDFNFTDDGTFVSGGYDGFTPSWSAPCYCHDTGLPVQDNTTVIFSRTVTTDYAAGAKWQPTDRLHVDLDLQYVKATAYNYQYTAFAQENLAGYRVDLSNSIPNITFTAPPGTSLTDLSDYHFTAMMDHLEDSNANQKAGRLDLKWDFDGALSSIHAGVRYTDKTSINRSTPYVWTGATNTALTLADPSTEGVVNPYASDFFGGQAPGMLNYVPFAAFGLLNDPAAAFEEIAGRGLTAFDSQDINTQHEKTYAGYASAYFKFDVGVPIDANLAVRVVKTSNDAVGSARLSYRSSLDPTASTVTVDQPFSGSQDYTNVLPSLNARVHLTNRLQLRLAASKALSRPPFADLTAVRNFSVGYSAVTDANGNTIGYQPNNTNTGSGGNPDLKPETADQADAALEWNISRSSFVYGTLFYKKVHNFITNAVYNVSYDVPGQGTQTFQYTGYVNGTKGTIKGFEVGGNTFFDFLPGPLSGLGLEANLTYVDSNAPGQTGTLANGDPAPTQLQGLSKWSYNIVGMYEKYGLTARLAYNWRSSSLQTISGNGTGAVPIYVRPYGQLDASIGYDFNPKVSVTIDATNLTKSQYNTYQYYPEDPRNYELDDRRFGITFHVRT